MSKKEASSSPQPSWDDFNFPDFIEDREKFQQIMEQAYIDVPKDIKVKTIGQVVRALITKIKDDAIGDYLFDANLEDQSQLLSILKKVTANQGQQNQSSTRRGHILDGLDTKLSHKFDLSAFSD